MSHPAAANPADPEAVRAIVAEVLRRLHREPAAPPPASRPVGSVAADSGSTAVAVSGRVVTLAMLESLPPGTRRVVLEANAVITPSARDHAREKGLALDRLATGAAAPSRGPFLVAHAECGGDAAARAAGIVRGVPGASQLPASGLADVVAALAVHASRDAARGILLAGRPALAAAVANRSASLRAVTARDPAALAAAAAECNANLLVVDPATFPAAALLRLANELAVRPTGDTPAPLAARPAGCGCKGH